MKTRFENKLELSGLFDKPELKPRPKSKSLRLIAIMGKSIFGLKSSSSSKSLVAKDRSGRAVYLW